MNRQLFNPTKLYPQQKILLGSPDNSVIVAKGGAGTAKTTGGVLKLYEYLSRYPGAYILVIMQTLNQLRMVFKETWESIAPEKHYKYSDMGNYQARSIGLGGLTCRGIILFRPKA